ncbi:DUF2190 family protein [Aestuariibius insulae]|uniref:DUF2190 family protein n=1 Tax=Aestuariibius insulae TaxID=2058287 RepID=UPI00345F01AE
MKNFIQNGEALTVPAPADTKSGEGVGLGVLFGVAAGDALSGEPLVINTTGVYELPKVASQAWSVGAAIFWNGSACTTSSTGNLLIGAAADVTSNPSETGAVRLNGSVPATST